MARARGRISAQDAPQVLATSLATASHCAGGEDPPWDPANRTSLLGHYSRWYSDGLIDLSSSAAPAQELAFTPRDISLDYCPPRGAEGLRTLISNLYERIEPDGIVLTCGASEALVALVHAVRPRRIAVERGVYESLLAACERLRVEMVPVGTGAEAGLTVRCNPTIPDGRLHRHIGNGGRLVMDEVELAFCRGPNPPPPAVDQDHLAVSVNSFSKSLGFGGLRLGWVASRDRALIEELDRQVQLLSGGPAAPSVALAERILPRYGAAVETTIAAVGRNAPEVFRELSDAGWTLRIPEAGLTVEAWPPEPRMAHGLVQRLHTAGYFVLPCSVYGTPGSFRFSLLADPSELRTALGIAAA